MTQHGMLNLLRVFFQIYISLAVLSLAYFFNPSIVHLFSSIYIIHTQIHVFTSPLQYHKFQSQNKVEICSTGDLHEIITIDNVKMKIYLILKIAFSYTVLFHKRKTKKKYQKSKENISLKTYFLLSEVIARQRESTQNTLHVST